MQVEHAWPEQRYESMADIFKAVGQVEPMHQGRPF
jgi:type III secretion system FlhB-like substrate exporter